MSKFVCDAGHITFAGSDLLDGASRTACIKNVSVDVKCDTVSYTCMATGGNPWQSNDAATKSWTCSFDVALDTAEGIDLGNTLGVKALLTFDTVDGLAFAGNAIITSVSVSAPVDEFATASFEATGDGALTEE